jgi:uncharacterized protein (DUF302 family)
LCETYYVLGIKKPGKAIAKMYPGIVLPKVSLVEVCSPKHAKSIIENHITRGMSIMMPCTVSVYDSIDTDGNPIVLVRSMRADIMGFMFGPKVFEIMENVAADQKVFLDINKDIP